MSEGYCTVVYDGKGQAGGIAGVFRLKGVEFPTGKPVEVSADLAGLLVKTGPPGTVKVTKGTPSDVSPMSNQAKAAARQAAQRIRAFPSDPAEALSGMSPLPAEILQGISGKDAVSFIDSGKADTHLGAVAMLTQLAGQTETASAAARRSVELIKKAAGKAK